MGKFTTFARIAEIEFADIVLSTQDLGHKLRIYLNDKSFIDLSYTTKLTSLRFSIHWERIHIDGTIYRIDNTPDKHWRSVPSFPVHFHKETYNTVTSPPFTINKNIKIDHVLRDFLHFAKPIILQKKD